MSTIPNPYAVPVSQKKPIKRSSPHSREEETTTSTPRQQLTGIYQPNGFPTRRPPVKPWVPGLSTPTTRPTAVVLDTGIPNYIEEELLWTSPTTRLTQKIPKMQQTYSFLVTSTLSSTVIAIPGLCWLVASKIGYF